VTGAGIQIGASPANPSLGQVTVISWSVHLPGGCAGVQSRLNGHAVPLAGSESVVATHNARYTITVSHTRLGVYSETSRSVSVPVTYPDRVVITPFTPDPVGVLLGALDSANASQTVELCDVDLDLTGVKNVTVGSNRSLVASPSCERSARRPGPRLFVTDTRGRDALFVIRGDNVRFSGFRLEGPSKEIAQGDTKEKGIVIWPFADPAPIRHIEISNMEVFHWSGVAVEVADNVESAERGRLFNTNPGAVRVFGSYFHNNRHGEGEGYGVTSSAGAYATIEQNVFDENRHAIAGGSRNLDALDYSGYTARDNLILPGGGLHCSEGWWWALTGWRFNCWQTHQIDMHGDENEWYSSHNWQCGRAGETMLIERNTILYTEGLAIKIRGNPADKVVIDGNVFKHGSRGDAIAQNGACGAGDNISRPLDVRPNNTYGADPMAQLGRCDFSGDGQQDDFMATGVTWWARSPVTGQWRYLNTMTESLPQLVLRDLDGDGVCDVGLRADPTLYSRRGTGPWQRRSRIDGVVNPFPAPPLATGF
jgi:hypothetical protein